MSTSKKRKTTSASEHKNQSIVKSKVKDKEQVEAPEKPKAAENKDIVWVCSIWTLGHEEREGPAEQLCFARKEFANRFLVARFLLSAAAERDGRSGHLAQDMEGDDEKEWNHPLLKEWSKLDKEKDAEEEQFIRNLTDEQCSSLVKELDKLSSDEDAAFMHFTIGKRIIHQDDGIANVLSGGWLE